MVEVECASSKNKSYYLLKTLVSSLWDFSNRKKFSKTFSISICFGGWRDVEGDLHTCIHQCFVYVYKPKISVYPPLTHTHPFGLFIRGSGYLDFHEKVFMGGVFINFATSCDSKRPPRRSLNERVRTKNFPVEFKNTFNQGLRGIVYIVFSCQPTLKISIGVFF